MDDVQKKLLDRGFYLPVMEHFYTIQGEGYHTGKASYFIRIGGCDVGCHWCDVKDSWDASKHPLVEVNQVVAEAKKYADSVVITGGEPLMWDMDFLTDRLKAEGMNICLETSGAHPFSGTWDWICLSPKKLKKVQPKYYKNAHELKVIIYNHSDFEFAELHAREVSQQCKCYLQPEWSKRDKMAPKIVDYVMKNPKWQISIQTHKYLSIP